MSRSSGNQLTFIDLFSGCGGFTLGMIRAGFRCVAAIDSDKTAIAVLEQNLGDGDLALPKVEWPLQRDLTKFSPKDLCDLTGIQRVDVIVGGPPCQGFSTARQVDGSNHGERLKADPRRFLYREFLRYVAFFQPKIFVMENVLGLRTAAGGAYFTAVQKEARHLGNVDGRGGYRVHAQVEDAWELGVPQKRRRQLIIGVHGENANYFSGKFNSPPRASPRASVGMAIGDLPIIRAGSGVANRRYDLRRRADHIRTLGMDARRFLFGVLEIGSCKNLTGHVARPHSDRDLRDFAKLKEGESSAVAMRVRKVRFEFPYDKKNFKDRYTRQSRNAPCSTIVAHLSKDGLMFIHPTQNRSITPREAARIQTFPDWFKFPDARTHAFRLIGNAVPPLVAEAVGLGVKLFLSRSQTLPAKHGNGRLGVAKASLLIRQLVGLDRSAIRRLPQEEFVNAWRALLALFPFLHPGNALDHGAEVEGWRVVPEELQKVSSLLRHRYARSGWPVALSHVGKEAWRRYHIGSLRAHELYPTGTAH